MSEPYILLENIVKVYPGNVLALDGVSISILGKILLAW